MLFAAFLITPSNAITARHSIADIYGPQKTSHFASTCIDWWPGFDKKSILCHCHAVCIVVYFFRNLCNLHLLGHHSWSDFTALGYLSRHLFRAAIIRNWPATTESDVDLVVLLTVGVNSSSGIVMSFWPLCWLCITVWHPRSGVHSLQLSNIFQQI